MPVEVMRTLAGPPLRRREPRLAGLDRLVTRWMNGVLFYLDTDEPIVHGHTIYIDSEWALTSISQAQFWGSVDLTRYGDGTVRGILSVDVSDWDTPGRRTGKVASRCSPDEIRAEVWGQLADHLNDGSETRLHESRVLDWFLDPAIEFPNPTGATNLEPLLINTPGSWSDRPEAATRIANLMLAADYVRTNTDLATMEGANEAARRAVNAILDATRSPAPRCALFELAEPAILRHARRLDRVRWLLRRPARPPLRVDRHGALTAKGVLGRRRRRARLTLTRSPGRHTSRSSSTVTVSPSARPSARRTASLIGTRYVSPLGNKDVVKSVRPMRAFTGMAPQP